MLRLKWFMGEKEDLSEVYAIRRDVFVEEQGVDADIEFDGTDGSCIHLLVYDEDIPVATGRVLITDDYFKLGRVATLMTHRGRGIATALVESLIGACVKMGGERQIVHAQLSAKGFYEKVGFTPYGEEFLEASIPHIAMEHFGGASKCGGGCGGCGCSGEGCH